MSEQTVSSAPKIASSLSAACDIPAPPATSSDSYNFLETYIIANAPNIMPASVATANSNNEEQQNSNNSNNNNEQRQLQIRNALIHFRDGEGRTPLQWAFALKNFDLAKKLMGLIRDQQNQNQDTISPSWALPPDTNSTTILSTACAVTAPIELVTELIFLATGISPPVSNGENQQQQQQKTSPAAHPFIETQDAQGNTALLIAASRGNMKLITLLTSPLYTNADPRIKNKRGQTILHRIVSRGDTSSVEEIILIMRKRFPIEVKKFINAPDASGDTALHYASMEENREMGEFLLRNGADRNVKNKEGKEFWQL